MPNKKVNDYGTGVTRHQIEALARCLLPELRKHFDSEDGQRKFEEWKKKQSSDRKSKNL